MSAAQPFRTAAAKVAGDGFDVLPLAPGGKAPLTRHGVKDATSDFAQIAKWADRWPNANIGVRVPEDVVVLDVDVRSGGLESWDALVSEVPGMAAAVANTRRTETPTGGFHVWLRLPEGFADRLCGNISGYPGIDVKSYTGYVVVPPSVRSDCDGRAYTWNAE